MSKKPKNPICAILWQDAAYAYTKNVPGKLPLPQLTVGFVISSNDKFTNIATNVNYNIKTGTIYPVDGFVIPKKTQIKFQRIGFLNK